MNKKVYQKPTIDVKELALETEILAASGEISASFDDNDVINSGSIDARPSFSAWGSDEDED